MCGNKASTVYRACSIQFVCVYADHIYIHIYNIYIYILSGIQNMFSQADAAGGAAAGGEGGGVVCDGVTIVDVGAHVGLAAIAFAMRCIFYIYIFYCWSARGSSCHRLRDGVYWFFIFVCFVIFFTVII